jgi:hypothetical protein
MLSISSYMILWLSSVVWPLYCSYRHQWRLSERLAAVTSVTTLNDLLLIHEGWG